MALLKTVFIKTDPTFMIAEDMVTELRENNHLNVVGLVDITSNDFIHGNDEGDDGRFMRLYDFAQTSRAVLRYYMLVATSMVNLFDPHFEQIGKDRNIHAMQRAQFGEDINMAADQLEAKRLAAEFDRLYPTFAILNKLHGIEVGDVRSVPNQMYVVDMENSLLYQIVANMDVTFVEDHGEGLVIHARPHIAAFRVHLQQPGQDHREDFPRYFYLQGLIERHNANGNDVEAILQGIGDLNLAGDDEDDDLEEVVNDYFNNLPVE